MSAPFSSASSAPASPRGPGFPVILTASVGVALLLAAGLELRRSREEAARLRKENSELSALFRHAESRPLPVSAALPDSSGLTHPAAGEDGARILELEEVIVFLREEIKAAQETIERMKAGEERRKNP